MSWTTPRTPSILITLPSAATGSYRRTRHHPAHPVRELRKASQSPHHTGESSEIWSYGPEAADAMVARPVACNSLTFRAKGPCELTVNKVASFSFSPPPVLFITSTCAEPRYRPRLQRWQNPPSIRHESRNFPRNPSDHDKKKSRGGRRRTLQIWYCPTQQRKCS